MASKRSTADLDRSEAENAQDLAQMWLRNAGHVATGGKLVLQEQNERERRGDQTRAAEDAWHLKTRADLAHSAAECEQDVAQNWPRKKAVLIVAAAVIVVEPEWGAAEAFGLLALAVLVFVGPVVAVCYGLLYKLPERWFEWGRWRWLPDDWFRKNPLITGRRALRFVVIGAALAVLGWPVMITAAGVAPPVVVLVLLVPFAVLAVDWFRALTRRSQLAAIVGFLVLVTVVPTVVAAFSRPRIERDGEQRGLFFEADGLSVAHRSTPEGERPIVILGATVLGDIVIYDTCLDTGNAEVVAREEIIVPTTLATCP